MLKSDTFNIFTGKVNKCTNDDERIQTPNGGTTYTNGYECWAEPLNTQK